MDNQRSYMRHFRIRAFSLLCFLSDLGRWIFVGPGDLFSPLFSFPVSFLCWTKRRKITFSPHFPLSLVFPRLFTRTKHSVIVLPIVNIYIYIYCLFKKNMAYFLFIYYLNDFTIIFAILSFGGGCSWVCNTHVSFFSSLSR